MNELKDALLWLAGASCVSVEQDSLVRLGEMKSLPAHRSLPRSFKLCAPGPVSIRNCAKRPKDGMHRPSHRLPASDQRTLMMQMPAIHAGNQRSQPQTSVESLNEASQIDGTLRDRSPKLERAGSEIEPNESVYKLLALISGRSLRSQFCKRLLLHRASHSAVDPAFLKYRKCFLACAVEKLHHCGGSNHVRRGHRSGKTPTAKLGGSRPVADYRYGRALQLGLQSRTCLICSMRVPWGGWSWDGSATRPRTLAEMSHITLYGRHKGTSVRLV